ncbi:MAG: patatin-like phospholipase family protein [Pseudomonadota bacterium]
MTRLCRSALILIPALVLVSACTGVRPLPAPKAEQYELAEIPGYPGARVWGDASAPNVEERLIEFISQIRARAVAEGGMPNGGRLDSLVLSGGGSDGPFGAGLLVGWTETGARPEFTFVTGISAGALIAPFAFLGPQFDSALEEFSVENSTETLVTLQILSGILDGIGLVDNSKLRQKLRGLITPEVVLQIAAEHEKGRRLIIGTTNLDAQRPVYWGVSQIASQGRDRPEETADLITKIMLASASIPGAFPPQFFTVETPGGGLFTEMHVDGGVTNQLFFLPAQTRIGGLPEDIERFVQSGTIYIVRNTKISPDYEPIPPGIVQIASRSISTMIKFGGRSDIKVLEEQARIAGFGVKVTAVPDSFQAEETELFDPVYMRALFEVGRDMADDPGTWTLDVSPGAAVSATGSGAAAGG